MYVRIFWSGQSILQVSRSISVSSSSAADNVRICHLGYEVRTKGMNRLRKESRTIPPIT